MKARCNLGKLMLLMVIVAGLFPLLHQSSVAAAAGIFAPKVEDCG